MLRPAIANQWDTRFPTIIGQSAGTGGGLKADAGISAYGSILLRLGRRLISSAQGEERKAQERTLTTQKPGRLAVDEVVICVLRNPNRHLIRRWNWKSACLSAVTRGILILIANLSAGRAGAVGAMIAEICYRALTSGFYSALTQAFRFARPVWAASMVPMLLVPLLADGFEFIMHGIRGTQCLGATLVASVVFTSVSTLIEFFLMRHGILVMGRNSRSLLQDLKAIPMLVGNFLARGLREFSS